MADASLRQYEHEVEHARAKLASDLAMLRSPSTYTSFTDDLKSEKEVLLGKARSAAQSTLSSVLEDLKAKAVANPAAALVIGAGIAWRLLRDPPIATALVGIGLFSLLRTQASAANGREAGSFENGGGITEQARRLASRAAASVADAGQAVGEKASDLVEAATTKVAELSDAASAKATQLAEAARSKHLVEAGRDLLQETDARDKLLLGAAALVIATAVGMAMQRRMIGNEDSAFKRPIRTSTSRVPASVRSRGRRWR
jgi:hypothetical protein